MYENDRVSKKQSTKECIKTHFLDIYKTKPLRKITICDLIKVCNISRGTFYFHYEDIYALYHECENDLIKCLEGGLSDVNLSTVRRDYHEHIKVFSSYLEKYIEHADIIKCFLTGSEGTSFRKAWLQSINQGFSKPMEFSADMTPSKRYLLTLFYSGGIRAVLSHWVLEGCREEPENIANIQAQILYQGMFSK